MDIVDLPILEKRHRFNLSCLGDVGVPEYERARREEAKRLDAVRRTAERNE
jgi:aminopeptidase-like protein